MAKLYYRYGAMSSSKTANAIMVKHNYAERGQKALLVKPRVDLRDGLHTMKSRSGLCEECVLFDEIDIDAVRAHEYDCIIVDEAQFLTKQEVLFLTDVVDLYNVPVICYGLRADFSGSFFPGSQWLMAWGYHRGDQDHLLVRAQGHLQRPSRREGRHHQSRRAGRARRGR